MKGHSEKKQTWSYSSLKRIVKAIFAISEFVSVDDGVILVQCYV